MSETIGLPLHPIRRDSASWSSHAACQRLRVIPICRPRLATGTAGPPIRLRPGRFRVSLVDNASNRISPRT